MISKVNLEGLLAKRIVAIHQKKWWTLNMSRQWWSDTVIKGIWCTILYKGTCSYNGSIYWLLKIFFVTMGIRQSSAAQIWLQCVRLYNPLKMQLYDAQISVKQQRVKKNVEGQMFSVTADLLCDWNVSCCPKAVTR